MDVFCPIVCVYKWKGDVPHAPLLKQYEKSEGEKQTNNKKIRKNSKISDVKIDDTKE